MTTQPELAPQLDRPDFMATLGLVPPCTLEDVEAAYREKAKEAHPDRGGSVAGFQNLQEAVNQAREYLKFRANRRQWLAANVDRYLPQIEVCAEVQRLGGDVEIENLDWTKQSFGDFAVVAERLRGITARGLADGDGFLRFLAGHKDGLGYLLRLDVAGSRLSDRGLAALSALGGLRRLDVSGTPISAAGLGVLDQLPELEWLNLADTAVGWWARRRLRRSFPQLHLG